MITLRYSSPYFVAGLWLGELPDAIYPAEAVVERVVSALADNKRPPAQAAAEVSIIYGPRAEYGLLGATFTPDGSTGCACGSLQRSGRDSLSRGRASASPHGPGRSACRASMRGR